MMGERKKRGPTIKTKHRRWLAAYCFLLPAMLLWIYWFLVPAVKSFAYGFLDYSYIGNSNSRFVGFENYLNLFKDKNFIRALQNSFVVVAVAVPVQTVISLFMALLVDRKIRGKGVFRTLFYMPYVLSSVAVATVFIYLFAQDGFLTRVFTIFGFPNSSWATNINLALPLVIIMFVWQGVGFYMLMFLSGLQSIPADVLESAQVDGANSRQVFFKIKLPMLQPTTFLVITYGIINAFLIFDQISTIAGSGTIGSPGGSLYTIVTFYYLNAYRFGDIGYGSAAATILFIIVFLITLIQSRFMDRRYEL